MKSPIKRSIIINGRKTSVSIEDIFWSSLNEIAKDRAMTLAQLLRAIRAVRTPKSNLSSAVRVYVLDHFRNQVHILAGREGARTTHGSSAVLAPWMPGPGREVPGPSE